MSTLSFDIASVAEHLPKIIDAYICCASYEDRSYVLAEAIPLALINRAAVFVNENILQYVGKNADRLLGRFKNCGERISIDSANPILTGDKMLQFCKSQVFFGEPKNCLVDITTFTHEELLILFKVISTLKRREDKVFFSYVNAEEYSIGLPQESKWLSKGVSEIRSVLGYSGELLPSKKNHLIIIVGYEHERASQLIAYFEPNKLSLAFGVAETATSDKNHAANAYFHHLLVNTASIYGNIGEFKISCNNPLPAKQVILEYLDANAEYNNILVPMNTKLSTIACALASFEKPSLQLCYAQPLQYNYLNYSKPGKTCYFIYYDSLFVKNK
jgi:hypothetical protein